MDIVLMILVAVLVFGAVIFIHELGHFLFAKKSHIKVNEFALGMGPTLFSFKKGETKYALRVLPIGGFVSMEGEDGESEEPRSFQRAPVRRRLLVIAGGALMNFVLGFLALCLLIATGGPIASKTVSRVSDEGTGLQVGDIFLEINGRHAFIMNDMSYEFARTQNGTFDLLVRRDGEKVHLTDVSFPVVEAVDEQTGEPIIDETTGEPYTYMDVGFAVLPVEKNFFTVVREAFLTTLSYGRLIYLTLFDLIVGRVPINQLSGPVGIVDQIGKAIAIGWRSVVQLLALISINLGIMNLLPLPALDGGKLLLLAVEGVRRKPIAPKYEVAINMAGFAMLMGLMVFVTFNDITRLVR
ncbi:site-2 protease family protein [Ruminococcaceae bacterium OttesenSCG-928-I18]|nr:site-2 protease family protein [Ruminococcaceae bacterium OttesenSCG-928-I18]